MIGAPNSNRSRGYYRLFAAVGAAVALFGVACAKDALLTSPLTVPSGKAMGVNAADAGTVVISQVYGGGGNSGAELTNDFIELHNVGSTDASLDGWSVQYASAGNTTWQVTAISGVLAPGQFYLVQEAKGAGGTKELTHPNATGSIAMSATSGKVALVKADTALKCGTTAIPCSDATQVADFVGYGSASFAEGTPTPALTNLTAALRNGDGCTDNGNNLADFTVGAPAPRNEDITIGCGEIAPRVAGTLPTSGGELNNPPTISVTFTEPVTVSGNWFAVSCAESGAHTGVTTGGPRTFTISNLGEFTPGESCAATVAGAAVADVDSDDPPDTMVADFSWTFQISQTVVLPDTRFSEIHYDNGGDDVNEQIEIEGPANTDLSGWSIVLYNGGSGDVYDQRALTGLIPATCGDRGVVVVPFASIQNGSPDGFALIHNSEVVQFLSYEGSFTAIAGPAAGRKSTDIKVEEPSSSSAISSLQLNAETGKWVGPARRTFGRCNSDGPLPFDITFSGRQPISDPPIPVGFEDQLFPTMVDVSGATVRPPWRASTRTVLSMRSMPDSPSYAQRLQTEPRRRSHCRPQPRRWAAPRIIEATPISDCRPTGMRAMTSSSLEISTPYRTITTATRRTGSATNSTLRTSVEMSIAAIASPMIRRCRKASLT